jgi:hypothetical protein
MNPTLKASGTKRLKVEYDELLSGLALNFNLRRYSREAGHVGEIAGVAAAAGFGEVQDIPDDVPRDQMLKMVQSAYLRG